MSSLFSSARAFVWLGLSALCACAGPPRATSREIPPPRLDPTVRQSERSARTPTDDGATREFLQQEVERRAFVRPRPAPPVVERRVYVESPRRVYHDPYFDYHDSWHDPDYDYYVRMHSYPYGRRYHSTFPLNTAVGAGLGAIIGHQSGRRDKGALIGGGVGLLFDLFGRRGY